MPPTSLLNMQRSYGRPLCWSMCEHRERVQVLDIGGADVNGSY